MSKRKNFLTQDNAEMFIVVLFFTLLFAIQILAVYWQVEEREREEKTVSQRIEQTEQKLQQLEAIINQKEKNHDRK